MVAVHSILPPLLTLLATFAFNGTPKQTDAQSMQLHGKVRAVKETSYLAEQNDGTVIKGAKVDPSLNINDMHYRFNETGNFVEQVDSTSDRKFVQRIVFVYNAGGDIAEERVENGDGSLNHKEVVIRRDERGNKTEAKLIYSTLSSSFKVTFKYDERNNLTETCIFHDAEVFLKFQYKYDANNREIENLDVTAGERLISRYDADGKRTDETRYNLNGEMLGKKEYKYDANGNTSEIRKYGKDNTLLFTTGYTYELDAQKNWIRKVEYYNGKPLLLSERVIEYYP